MPKPSGALRASGTASPELYVPPSEVAAPIESRPRPQDARIGGLDGLRGVAILIVIAHNVGSVPVAMDGILPKLWAVLISNPGWIGVQFFFALSGFLITRILLESKGAPGALRSFYARRVLRIFPLYYAVLVLLFFVAPHVAALGRIAGAGPGEARWYWTYLSNWSDPFGRTVQAAHFWSLAVEEQFYLAWPLIVVALTERSLARLCVIMFLGALVARQVLHLVLSPDVANQAAYEFTITRCDTIALGALVAIGSRHPRVLDRLRQHLGTLLLAPVAVFAAVVLIAHGIGGTGRTAELINQPISGILSAVIVLACIDPAPMRRGPQAFVKRVLSTRWLSVVGKYSYAIYVFHLLVT